MAPSKYRSDAKSVHITAKHDSCVSLNPCALCCLPGSYGEKLQIPLTAGALPFASPTWLTTPGKAAHSEVSAKITACFEASHIRCRIQVYIYIIQLIETSTEQIVKLWWLIDMFGNMFNRSTPSPVHLARDASAVVRVQEAEDFLNQWHSRGACRRPSKQ